MLEIIATTLQDAKIIEKCGADRIELVSALTEGGLTPSYSLIKNIVNSVKIPVNVMIRPHAKSFRYTDEEINIMREDILIAKELKVNGVVFGVLNEKNEINVSALETLLKACDGIDVTFHKALDLVPNKVEAMELLSKYPQIKNVLTAGGEKNVCENITTIKNMIEKSGHISLMVGGGLNFDNVLSIANETKAPQYHFGTAVRINKSVFEDVDEEKLSKLVKMIKSIGM